MEAVPDRRAGLSLTASGAKASHTGLTRQSAFHVGSNLIIVEGVGLESVGRVGQNGILFIGCVGGIRIPGADPVLITRKQCYATDA